MFENLNKGAVSTIQEGIDLLELEFIKLREFIGDTLLVKGFFFTNGKYGEQVVVVGYSVHNGRMYKVNFPNRAVEQFKTIQNNKEQLQALLDGKLSIVDIKEVNGKNGKFIAYTFKG